MRHTKTQRMCFSDTAALWCDYAHTLCAVHNNADFGFYETSDEAECVILYKKNCRVNRPRRIYPHFEAQTRTKIYSLMAVVSIERGGDGQSIPPLHSPLVVLTQSSGGFRVRPGHNAASASLPGPPLRHPGMRGRRGAPGPRAGEPPSRPLEPSET